MSKSGEKFIMIKLKHYFYIIFSIMMYGQLFGQSSNFKNYAPCIFNENSLTYNKKAISKLNLTGTVEENNNFRYQQNYGSSVLPSSYFGHNYEFNISKKVSTMSSTSINNKIKNFITSDKDIYNLKFLNNFLFLIPPLVWNIAYGSNNPAQLVFFEGDAPNSILIAENFFRITSMMYPVFLPINSKNKYFKIGLISYTTGLIIYFSSWAYLMNNPASHFSESPILRFAPAYTPIIWLSGISLMSNSKIHFTLSGIFIGLHVTEYLFRY